MNGFLRQLGGELHRMFARKRTHIGFGVFITVELLVLWFLRTEKVQAFFERALERNAYAFETYFSAITLGFLITVLTIVLLGGLFLALVSGDIVAKEVEDGTMRMVLSRPVTRFRLLATKYLSCFVYTVAFILFIGLSALAVGLIHRGWGGGFFAWAPEHGVFSIFGWWTGLGRYLLALGFLALSMQTVSSAGFCLSCFPMKPAAATILTLTLLFVDFVLSNWPALAGYRHWFATPRMDAWVWALRDHLPWGALVKNYAFLFGVQASFFVIGWAGFQSRDLKA